MAAATNSMSGEGVECFDSPEALAINRARLEHLVSLRLDLSGKRALDVGCGVGHLADFLVGLGCQVVCVDGRAENIDSLHCRYPHLEAHVANVESDSLSHLGWFDIVFCYGLLYHLENPLAFLTNCSAVCKELLLLETVLTDHDQPVLLLVDEPPSVNQALFGLGCRPSPQYVIKALHRAGFRWVYRPRQAPQHPDFYFSPRNDLSHCRDGHLLRGVFVGSRQELRNPRLELLSSRPVHRDGVALL